MSVSHRHFPLAIPPVAAGRLFSWPSNQDRRRSIGRDAPASVKWVSGICGAALLALLQPGAAFAKEDQGRTSDTALAKAADEAERQLQQTFTNLRFEDFGPSPVEGPIYQASAGGRIVYYAPQSEHILFATVYDRNGVNLTALAQEQGATRRLKAIDPAKALAIGPIQSTPPGARSLLGREGSGGQAGSAAHLLRERDPPDCGGKGGAYIVLARSRGRVQGGLFRPEPGRAGAMRARARQGCRRCRVGRQDRHFGNAHADRRRQAHFRVPAGRARGFPRQPR